MKTSFGKYFDDQRDRVIKAMQTGKNTELYNAWREDYDKRQAKKQELALLKKMAPVGPKEKKLLKEMIEEVWSDERLDALHQVNMADTHVDKDTRLFWWEAIGT